jgi:hypothetical protein
MQIRQKRAFVFDIDRILEDFARLLEAQGCHACVTIPDAVLVTAVFNQVIGYSPFRGTAYVRVMDDLQVFGLPPLVAEDLFRSLCALVSARVKMVSQCDVFYTDFYYKLVDSTTVALIER